MYHAFLYTGAGLNLNNFNEYKHGKDMIINKIKLFLMLKKIYNTYIDCLYCFLYLIIVTNDICITNNNTKISKGIVKTLV